MKTYRTNALVVGVLFIVATVAGITSGLFVPSLFGPEDLANVWQLAESQNQVNVGMLLELVMAVAAAGVSIWAYPVVRKHGEAMALGYVGARIAEGTVYIVGVISLLSLLTLSQEFAAAGAPNAPYYEAIGSVLLAIRLGGGVFGPTVYGLGALLFYYLVFKSKLVPRWLSIWGLVGAAMFFLSGPMPLFGYGSRSTVYMLMSAPGGLNELVLAIWLIVKGFNPSETASEPAGSA